MLEVRRNHNANVVCLYARGPKVSHYLGLDGVQLSVLQLPNDDFDREYDKQVQLNNPLRDAQPIDFAQTYLKTEPGGARMIPISRAAIRVLTAILRGQATDDAALSSQLTELENSMTAADTATPLFRKPDGPVAKVHAYLDARLEKIKAGTVSRKELIDAMVATGLSAGTVVTQCGVWAKTNDVKFVRPAKAEEEKAAAKQAAKDQKAADKAAAKAAAPAPAAKAAAPAKKTGK